VENAQRVALTSAVRVEMYSNASQVLLREIQQRLAEEKRASQIAKTDFDILNKSFNEIDQLESELD